MRLTRFRKLIDGWLLDDVVMWGESLTRDRSLAMAFELSVPDLGSLGTDAKNEWHEGWRSLLSGLSPDLGLQVHTYDGGDYTPEIDRFEAVTAEMVAKNPKWGEWGGLVRQRVVEAARRDQADGMLRRDRTVLWFGRRAGSGVPLLGFGGAEDVKAFVGAFTTAVRSRIESLSGYLPFGSTLRPLAGGELEHEFENFFGPSRVEGMYGTCDRRRSILDNFLRSDGAGVALPDGGRGFWMDGLCHSIIVLTGFPEGFFPGLMLPLMRSGVRERRLVQSFIPRNAEPEKARLKKDIGRLRNQAEKDPEAKKRLETAVERLDELASGRAVPFGALTMAVVWGATPEECQRNVAETKVAFGALGGAAYHQCDEPTQAIALFQATFPGHLQHNLGGKDGWELMEISDRLSATVCASSSYSGTLATADALVSTKLGGLCGISFWRGDQPQHAMTFGTKGGGKSVGGAFVLSQALPLADFAVVVDEGRSLATLALLQDATRIMPSTTARMTINRLDTCGLPLTEDIVAGAANFFLGMAASDNQGEESIYRRGLIEGQIWSAFFDRVEDEWALHEERKSDSAALAMLALAWRDGAGKRGSQMTILEAYTELLALQSEVPAEFERLWKHYRSNEDAIIEFVASEAGDRLSRQMACVWLTAELVPTLSMVAQALAEGGRHRDETANKTCRRLGELLRPWRTGGSYGQLFDGASTIDMSARMLYFDLTDLEAGDGDLKRLFYRLILAQTRKRVMTLPRALKKFVWLEEAGRIIEHTEGLAAVEEFFAQTRKYGCCAGAVLQSPRQLGDATRAKGLLDNVSQYFVFRPANPVVAEDLGRIIGLPDTAVTEMQRFPAPEAMPKHDRASFVLHATNASGRMECGVLRMRVPREVLYAAESSGEVFDRREQVLAEYSAGPVEGVLTEVMLAEAN